MRKILLICVISHIFAAMGENCAISGWLAAKTTHDI